MEQRCHLSMVLLTWLGLPLLGIVVGLRFGVPAGVFVFAVGVVGQILYIRWFPRMSGWMGYGSVADTPADAASLPAQPLKVTLYTANVCPFCPIIKRRLNELQGKMPLEVEEVDVTFRPSIIVAKGLRSVPVIEANGRLLVGNATSAQIAEFLTSNARGLPVDSLPA